MGISGGTPPVLAELVCPNKLPIAGMANKKNVYIKIDIFFKEGRYALTEIEAIRFVTGMTTCTNE